ncbi:hypothetical protein DAPPUDRAFT_242296 [Daphnia pulex]|uniref:Uncharacterized protein n=1 Tax=Daphnia pulex TaxID=6669 RepID=E9GGB5_DAPPU|nr:hypothetical protein DAPPUDRAFT_242296 [Daphnia pulex]|eukprot:EFX81372.1 hypothetical protein DAPPUDRAFT_242296 [Daphnia pulex]
MPRLPLKPLRTPYYVPAHAMDDIEKFITRNPTRPERIRSYKRRENNIVTAVAPPSLYMRCSTTPVVDLVMPSISRMHLVPKGKKKKPFLMDQMMTDIKSLKKERTTPTKSKVQKNKLPRVVLKTESKAAVAAEIAKAMKSKAPTIKKEANWTPTSSASSVLTTPAAHPSIKLTIRLKASKIHSSTEYEIVKLKNEDIQ